MNLGIDFRKLMCEDNGSGYKSTCANEENVDETGSPRRRELAYELTLRGFGLSGLDLAWVCRNWPGLVLADRAGRTWGRTPGVARAWVCREPRSSAPGSVVSHLGGGRI